MGTFVLFTLLACFLLLVECKLLKVPEESYQISAGLSLKLPCVTDQANVACIWSQNGNYVPSGDRTHYTMNSQRGDCSIRISNLTYPEDNAVWECQIPSLNLGRGNWPSTKLDVISKPVFKQERQTVYANLSSKTTLEQTFCADPSPSQIYWIKKPDFEWELVKIIYDFGFIPAELLSKEIDIKDDIHIKVSRLVPLPSSGNKAQCYTVALKFDNTDESVLGDYKVVVENQYDTAWALLTVEFDPSPDDTWDTWLGIGMCILMIPFVGLIICVGVKIHECRKKLAEVELGLRGSKALDFIPDPSSTSLQSVPSRFLSLISKSLSYLRSLTRSKAPSLK